MTARCPTCDRAEEIGGCDVTLSVASRHRVGDWNLRARKDCEAHEPDWHQRCLAAEDERDQLAAKVDALEQALAEAVAEWGAG